MKRLLSRWLGSQKQPELPELFEDLSAELPFACEHSGEVAVPNRQKILRQLQVNCQRQLQILQQILTLNSAVLLWTGPAPEQLSVYAFASIYDDLKTDPFPYGTGIVGALKDQDSFSLAPVNDTSPTLPYYQQTDQVGSFLAIKLQVPCTTSDQAQRSDVGILCLDRAQRTAWTEFESELAVKTAQQITAEVVSARQLFVYDRERHAYRRAFDGLRKLNSALGLDSTFLATADAVKAIVPADFFSISLAEGTQHRICFVQGDQADRLADQVFPIDQGLVGKVMKFRRTLPDNADYFGNLPVFSQAHLFADYRSLMIVPLVMESGKVLGAMTVAARQADKFTLTCREMLELVATQVVVKLQLANSHDQLNRLATVDALTGIANRRAYQCGFEAMLDRARRRGTSLFLILCDIDYFKRINDQFGHPFGDQVLQQIARLFDRVVRTNDLAARTGGEEFAILLEDSDQEGAWKVAERMRCLVAELELQHENKAVPVTISLGIAAFPQDAESMKKLVSCADQALYQAKAKGRNRTVVWQDPPKARDE